VTKVYYTSVTEYLPGEVVEPLNFRATSLTSSAISVLVMWC